MPLQRLAAVSRVSHFCDWRLFGSLSVLPRFTSDVLGLATPISFVANKPNSLVISAFPLFTQSCMTLNALSVLSTLYNVSLTMLLAHVFFPGGTCKGAQVLSALPLCAIKAHLNVGSCGPGIPLKDRRFFLYCSLCARKDSFLPPPPPVFFLPHACIAFLRRLAKVAPHPVSIF